MKVEFVKTWLKSLICGSLETSQAIKFVEKSLENIANTSYVKEKRLEENVTQSKHQKMEHVSQGRHQGPDRTGA